MKRVIKITLYGLGILLGLFIVFATAYYFMARSMVKKMNPVATGKIADHVFAIKDSFVNMYIIRCGDEYVAIDAGNRIETIRKELTGLGIGTDQVTTVFLTHSDGDHVGAAGLFPNAAVYISKQEEQLINGQKSRFAFFGNSIKSKNIKLLEDNQVTDVSGTLVRCISTPGHTPGSACYLIDDKYLFTGDCLRLVKDKVAEFYRLPNMDTEMQRKSITKLSRLQNIGFLFTAHDGMTNDVNAAFSDRRIN